MKYDSLEEFDQLVRKLGGHEGFDGAGDLVGVLGLWESSLVDLVDDRLSVWVLWAEDKGPKLLVLSLDEVSGLHLEEVVLVGDSNELLVTLTPGSLVGSEGKVGVPLLAVFTDDLGVVVLVVDEETLWVLVDVDVDLGEGVVQSWFLYALVVTSFEPGLEHSQFASLFEFVNEFWNGADSDRVQELLDVDLVAVELKKGSSDLWSSIWVDLEQVDLDELVLLVAVEVPGELLSETVLVTEVDEWSWIWQLALFQEVLDPLGVVV